MVWSKGSFLLLLLNALSTTVPCFDKSKDTSVSPSNKVEACSCHIGTSKEDFNFNLQSKKFFDTHRFKLSPWLPKLAIGLAPVV